MALLALAGTLTLSCSAAPGVVGAGSLPPPDGAQMVLRLFDQVGQGRRAAGLPPLSRDPALDGLAGQALAVLTAGVPDGTSVVDHLESTAPLPAGLEYGVGFEARTPGVDDRLRELASRSSGVILSEDLLGADPALDGIGWAAGGPWSVVVLRARLLRAADAPALRQALAAEVARTRPTIHPDPRLDAVAAGIVADGRIERDDLGRYRQAGGVPTQIFRTESDLHLPTKSLTSALSQEGPEALHEPWLGQFGTAATITEAGAVTFLVLATGEADHGALNAEIAAAEPRATELVNRARAEAALPPVRLDPRLVAAARQLVADSIRRSCLVGLAGCTGGEPPGALQWRARQVTWLGGEYAFTWYLAPAEEGDAQLTRFGAAATLAPDGTVWAFLVLAA